MQPKDCRDPSLAPWSALGKTSQPLSTNNVHLVLLQTRVWQDEGGLLSGLLELHLQLGNKNNFLTLKLSSKLVIYVHVIFLGSLSVQPLAAASNSAQMQPSRKQLGNPATPENIQSGAQSCLIDMLIAGMCV